MTNQLSPPDAIASPLHPVAVTDPKADSPPPITAPTLIVNLMSVPAGTILLVVQVITPSAAVFTVLKAVPFQG